MHSEKNLADNILRTISGDKDTVQVRRDMQRMGLEQRNHLFLQPHPRKPGRMIKPSAPYVLTPSEFDKFCSTLEALKTPSKYMGANLADNIRKKKWGSLKCHDFHKLMQGLLPLALRGLMQPIPRLAIMRICRVFRRICCKIWDPSQIDSLRRDVAVTSCLLEIVFPRSFFDVMTHFPLELVEQLDLCGPVSNRWMYPVERYNKTLKKYVKNMARPEASIARGYVQDQCNGFVTEYLHGMKAVTNRLWDPDDDDEDTYEKLEGASAPWEFTETTRRLAHNYVIRNSTVLSPFFQ